MPLNEIRYSSANLVLNSEYFNQHKANGMKLGARSIADDSLYMLQHVLVDFLRRYTKSPNDSFLNMHGISYGQHITLLSGME